MFENKCVPQYKFIDPGIALIRDYRSQKVRLADEQMLGRREGTCT